MTSADDATPALMRARPAWLLSQVSARAHGVMTALLGEAGARGYHVRVLATLAEFGPASQASLGRHAGMDRSDITATVGELAGAGLVRRTADADDRRRNVITITDAGLTRLRELDSILTRVEDEVFGPLSADERSVLTGMLERLVEDGTRA